MNDPAKPTREQRLAQRLRDNLHRRKAQSRAMATQDSADATGDTDAGHLPNGAPPR
ncbi:hypothetical protein V5740_05535 [Croceibacterium sp. TMG7-5b_MA50]|uniref:hypothetical protein n=1 Tax=Croceibacterium sp. TMG7-5b_MA50 TaxID=3121290 RepID=UPI003221D947